MKWRVCLAVALVFLCCSTPALAQRRMSGGSGTVSANETKFEITPLYGWIWGGTIRTYEGDFILDASGGWGVLVDITLRPGAQLELKYIRQDTDLYLKSGVERETLADIAVNYYQVGGLYEFQHKGNADFFGTVTLGATQLSPKNVAAGDEWLFSSTLGVGTKVFLSERIGLRLQADWMLNFVTSSMWCGWYGCSLGGQAISQGMLSAGLIFAF
jgi:hypothetical protein